MSERFEGPKGTFDYLPPLADVRAMVELTMLEQARLGGYQRMETPVFEETGLFARGVGQSTDVVQKEMYSFTDKGGRSMTLRPELTAGAVRALIEHGRIGGGLVKVAFSGPSFRYERPQAGRQRQFHQVDIEAIGSADPAVDADVILVGHEAFRVLGIEVTLLLTSLGDSECRPVYRERLLEFLRGLGDKLPSEVRARAEENPLRVLDMKDPYVQGLTADAPLMRDSLCKPCNEHDDTVRSLLADAGVDWVEAPRLVRGLDYYMRTTFEWQADSLEAAQNALGGGGRYDGLSDLVGGPPAPGIGWALGLDRTVLALERAGRLPEAPPQLQALVLPLTPAARGIALTLVRDLRRAGVAADQPYAERTLRGQMKAAAKAGAQAVVLLGDEELAAGQASVRDMAARDQERVALDAVVSTVVRIATTPVDRGAGGSHDTGAPGGIRGRASSPPNGTGTDATRDPTDSVSDAPDQGAFQ
ncbi:MAG TPA: histidine--tRNA ligase [Actinomycetes bacterium]|nr:histidine--tRNA ligase [Actinomycetes bacterium]